jgi:hypothetical protein
MAATVSDTKPSSSRHLSRDIGFWVLMVVSLGSIMGSGWLRTWRSNACRRPARLELAQTGHALRRLSPEGTR